MNLITPEIPTTSLREIDGGTDNRCYKQSLGDIHVPNSKQPGKLDINIPARHTSASAAQYSTISEVSTNTVDSASLTRSSNYNNHSNRRSTGLEPFERQLSLLDPMSDRVSIILVWQNLTVQIREDKKKEAFQRMKSYKTFVPKRKCLLNNTSGAITGGLWAVMGKFYLLT